MRRVAAGLVVLVGSAAGIGVVVLAACGGGSPSSGFPDAGTTTVTLPDGNVVTVPNNGDGGTVVFNPGQTEDGGSTVTYTDGGCAGLQCAIAATCSNDGGTTITGKIMDPAGTNPLYNILAYVPMYDPAVPSAIPAGQGIEPITGGVTFPSGVSCDSCSYLYSGNPIAVGTSGTDGTFTITNAPSGKNIPIVVQVGKWRTHVTVPTVTDCQSASAGEIKLPSSADGTDPIVSMPQIAISMGSVDSVECLPYRMGIAESEFVSGAGGKGHFHVFTGGTSFGGGGGGSPPTSSTNMWNTLANLEKYDVSLFSCEGSETDSANPQLLEQYVNAGGRAFLSHYHYAWLAGPLQNGGYTANADWGTNLATWNANDQGASGDTVGGKIVTTLNVGGGTFQKGVDLQTWLGNVGALGTSGVAATEVAVEGPAFDPKVTSANTISQAWATYDAPKDTPDSTNFPSAYFSFNTPVGAVAPPDGGAAPYCGRVVFSGLHVGAAKNDTTGGQSVPSSSNCDAPPLSPQEKVLEFMLFDLSSCVTPDKAPPGIPIKLPPPPPPK